MTILKGNKSLSSTAIFFIILLFIIGSLFFLRLGYSIGMLGLAGTFLLILVGSFIAIPASLTFAEMATNQKVEGEGHYYMISRTYGLSIGAVIGIILYMIQTISLAFYLIAFTEAFSPLLHYIKMDGVWGRPLICVPAYFLLIYYTHKKKSLFKVQYLMIVILILIVSLFLFLLGDSNAEELFGTEIFSIQTGNISESFLSVFNILFPAFACVVTGIGLTRPGRRSATSMTKAIITAILCGLLIFCISAFKLAKSAIPSDLVEDQFVMGKIALLGTFIIPIVVATTAFIAASIFVKLAPATLTGLADDGSIPLKSLNNSISSDKGKSKRVINEFSLTYFIAFFFMLKGELDYTAQFLSVLYLLLFGSVCLCSFLNDFGADPSYRPIFRTRWYVSLTGFLIGTFLLIMSYPFYAFLSFVIMLVIYFMVRPVHGNKKDISNLIQSALFQLNRHIQIYFQKNLKEELLLRWNPSVVCATQFTFESDKALRVMKWISYRFGYGSYIHLIEGNYASRSRQNTKEILEKLKRLAGKDNRVYLSILVVPSYHTALSQIIQIPVVPGKANNMVLLVYENNTTDAFQKLIEGIALASSAGTDTCVLIPSDRHISYFNGIHIWINSSDLMNMELMLNLSYVIMAHPDWKDGRIKVFDITLKGNAENERKKLTEMTVRDKLPFSVQNIEIIEKEEDLDPISLVVEKSKDAGLVLLSFDDGLLNSKQLNLERFNDFGDILYIKASDMKEII
jgi:amino acid transporter